MPANEFEDFYAIFQLIDLIPLGGYPTDHHSSVNFDWCIYISKKEESQRFVFGLWRSFNLIYYEGTFILNFLFSESA